MLTLGIFTGYFPYPVDEAIRRIKAMDFNTVQLDPTFKDIDMGPGKITSDKAKRIRDAFRDANLPVCAVSAYQNLVHPDATERKRRVDYVKELLRHARELGSPYVVTETGTFNPESDWVHHPKNKTEEGYAICRNVVADLVRTAHEHGSMLVIENYVNNVVGSLAEVDRLFADINHSSLGLLLDPTNYFDDSNIDHVDATLNRILDSVGDRVVIAHAKDCKRAADTGEKHAHLDATEAHSFRGAGAVELPAPGLGSLNYELYVKRLAERRPNIPLIIEHLDEGDIPRAKKFVDAALRKMGV